MNSKYIQKVLTFWFDELEPKQWWEKDTELDAEIREKFSKLHQAAIQCELFSWRSTAQGRLAEIIVLDQFSRNLFRDTAHAFAFDGMALALAQEAIERGVDQAVNSPEKAFFYMPYMHSESAHVHEEALRLFNQSDVEFNLEFELKHKAIIDRFGRYPHRNIVLERPSTAEELTFLQQPGSAF